jgi:hypothetical protein
MPDSTEVQWPGNALDATGGDLAAPLKALLMGLNLLEKPDELEKKQQGLSWETPASVQVITAGATSFSKWATAMIGSAGGVSVIAAYVGGFWKGSEPSLRIVSLSIVGGLTAVVAIAIAMIVRADVAARATASAAEYRARAAVAETFLRTCPRTPETARYTLKKRGDDQPVPVESFEVIDGALIAVTLHDRIPAMEIETLFSTPTSGS